MTPDKPSPLLIVEDDLALQKQLKWSLDQFPSVTADDRESALVQCRRHAQDARSSPPGSSRC